MQSLKRKEDCNNMLAVAKLVDAEKTGGLMRPSLNPE